MQPYWPCILSRIQRCVERWRGGSRHLRAETQAESGCRTGHPRKNGLAEGLAEEHRWVPNSGWITFHIRSERDLTHALWLTRLSYQRYALKADSDPRSFLGHEIEELHVGARFQSLLEKFVPSAQVLLPGRESGISSLFYVFISLRERIHKESRYDSPPESDRSYSR